MIRFRCFAVAAVIVAFTTKTTMGIKIVTESNLVLDYQDPAILLAQDDSDDYIMKENEAAKKDLKDMHTNCVKQVKDEIGNSE